MLWVHVAIHALRKAIAVVSATRQRAIPPCAARPRPRRVSMRMRAPLHVLNVLHIAVQLRRVTSTCAGLCWARVRRVVPTLRSSRARYLFVGTRADNGFAGIVGRDGDLV